MDPSPVSTSPTQNPWQRFWDRGGWWRALLLAAAYYGVYQLLSLLINHLPGGQAAAGLDTSDPLGLLIGTALPIALGAAVLIGFAASVGWLRPLFGPQPRRQRGWMWIGIGVVVAINASALITLDYGSAGGALVATWLLTGLCIGLAEELLTRGVVVELMRKAGYGEIAIAIASAGIFAALHSGNLFTTDQGVATTAAQVVYTFGFGIIMYLALRMTGRLIVPILLHASTDPTILLLSEYPSQGNPLELLPMLSTPLIVATGGLLLIVFAVSERRVGAGSTHSSMSSS